LVQTLLDPSDGLSPDTKTGTFLEHAYARHMSKIVAALTRIKPVRGSAYTNPYPAQYQAVELLSYCAQQHGPRARKFLLRSHVLTKISDLVKLEDSSSSKQLTCSVVRFFRTTIGLKQDSYIQYIVTKKLLDPMFEVFAENGARYNLLNSVVIELINFIRMENLRLLINYVISDHESKFKDINYVQTFKSLKHRWKQNQEHKENPKEHYNGIDNKGITEPAPTADEVEEDMFSRDSDSEEEDKTGERKDVVKKEEVDAEEEAKFLQNMEELKKKKRKLDEDRNEFDFKNFGGKSDDAPKKAGSPPAVISKVSKLKPTSPPGSMPSSVGQVLEGSPKRRKSEGSKA